MGIRKDSLQFKLFLIFLLTAFGLTAILGFLMSAIMEKSKEKELSAIQQKDLIFIDRLTSEFVNEVKEDLTLLSLNELVTNPNDAEFTNFLNADENTFQYNIGDLEQSIIKFLNDYRLSHNFINSVYMGRENGSFVRSHPRAKPTQYDPRERPWYIQAKTDQTEVVITDPYPSLTTNDINIGFEKALVDEDGTFFGVIGVDVTLKNLTDLLTTYTTGNSGQMIMLVDQNGTILACNDQHHLFVNYRHVFSDQAIQSMQGDSGSFETGDTFIVYYDSPSLGWKIISQTDLAVIRNLVRQNFLTALVYFLISFLLFGFIFFPFTNFFIFKPISNLTTNIDRVDLSGKLVQLPLNARSDEIGMLTKSFNNFISVISKQKNELTKFNKQLEKKILSRTKQLNMANVNLQESEQKYRNLVEDSVYKISRWKKDGTILFTNSAKIFRNGKEEVVANGQNIYDLFSPQIAKQLKAKIERLSPEKPTIETESKYYGSDGKWHWEEWIERGIFDKNGELIEIQSTGKDISELKQANETQQKLSSAIEHSPTSVMITNNEGIIEYVNPKFCEICGYSIHEVIGKNPSILKSGLHDKHFYEELWKTIKSGKMWKGEFINKDKHGNLYTISTSIAPIKNENGEITHYVSTREDISQQIEAKKALEESEKRLSHILNYSPIVVYINDMNGKYSYVNDEYLRVEKIKREDIIGKTDLEFYPGDLGILYSKRLQEVIRTREVHYYESSLGDGKNKQYFRDIIIPLVDEKGEVYSTCGWSWNISDQKNAQIETEKARTAAEEASLAKSSFVASMSHEIRTPLNAIAGLVYLLGKTKLTENQKNMINNIDAASDSLLNIVNDILDFSKIEAGKLEVDNIDFNIRKEMEKITSIIGFKAQSKGLDFNISVDPEIPERMTGDPTRLVQVLTNMAGNSVKFTSEGDIFIRLDLESENEKEIIINFSVEDTGIGISDEAKKKLFMPFVQAESSTTRNYGGTGLGLTICKLLVEKMGGNRISIDSKLGEGSTFSFQLPFVKIKSKTKRVFPPQLGMTNVFFVENSPHSELAMSNLLKSINVKCVGVDSCDKALGYITEKGFKDKYDLMIINLEVAGGPDLPHLKEILKNKLFDADRIIALINFNKEGQMETLEKLGVTKSLLNPATYSNMYDTIISMILKGDEAFSASGIDKEKEFRSKIRNSKILIVEDNAINQLVTSQLLEKLGVKYEIANNGKEAVDLVSKNAYDAVLMDIQMPVMDGIEASHIIRTELKQTDLPIIALTADVTTEVKESIAKVGMNDFLKKPIDIDDFQSKLVKWVKSKQKENPKWATKS
jgi:PAS domain S-box-containing protein